VDDSNHKVISYKAEGTVGDATNPRWKVEKKYNEQGTENYLLEPGEQFELNVTVLKPGPNAQFTVHLQPSAGAVYSIKRTVPPAIEKINILH